MYSEIPCQKVPPPQGANEVGGEEVWGANGKRWWCVEVDVQTRPVKEIDI